MIQHVRQRVAKLLPANPEISIPVSTVLETGVESVTAVTLRWGTVVSAAAVTSVHVWPESLPVRLLAAVLAAAAMDRSSLTHIRVRRTP
ncbi:hypothetical protein PV387_03070 [Streptomyces sp. ME02-6987-2C]|uniref:hypothetical protein n=1 Tax=unclassified Streptomyces TaxID=2593676 RepID=UPI0029B62C8B|nr:MULTISPECIES: hypothetical protein [unclassified Streptomyces]MDX3365014.1 hypothetical protein [Streptomyces sp. ME02-6987-2C]MDX3420785.1 hypothetical protein [Streptomyces sp. ME02-6985-2c]